MSKISLTERLYNRIETLITDLVPEQDVGPIFKWNFKIPTLQYRLCPGWLTGRYTLLLTTNVMGPYAATLYDYVRSEMKFESDLPYEILNWTFVNPWSFEEFENKYANVAETLRQAMTTNPHLKVFVANGYYDLGTPYFASEYTFNHPGLDESLRGSTSIGHYQGGHRMYIHMPSLAEIKQDLAAFITSSIPVRVGERK